MEPHGLEPKRPTTLVVGVGLVRLTTKAQVDALGGLLGVLIPPLSSLVLAPSQASALTLARAKRAATKTGDETGGRRSASNCCS